MNPAIRVERLSKRYRLGERARGGYRTLRESVAEAAGRAWSAGKRLMGGRRDGPQTERARKADTLWALRDVSFDVEPGEVVGVIGHNGAGKSTLLKVFSRITEPTSGRIEVRGRVASLLEVGTGFHPELTGRENIYLNGAILGMSRREIEAKFDEIVAFSGVEAFLDTPVKRYSSGMHVRLAFAVAAHLEPEILLIDEVLAVGDAAFQKKCLGKMQDVATSGRTVLFVSHNMALIQNLCHRAVLLECGRVIQEGSVDAVVARYMRDIGLLASQDLSNRSDRRGAGRVRVTKLVINAGNPVNDQVLLGQTAQFTIHVSCEMPDLVCILSVVDGFGRVVTRFNSAFGTLSERSQITDGLAVRCVVEEMLLAPGQYHVDVAIRAAGELQDSIAGVGSFNVGWGAIRGREPPRKRDWVVWLPHHWEMRG